MKKLSAEISAKVRSSNKFNLVYRPEFLRLNKQKDKTRFKKLLQIPGIIVCDSIKGQIKELIKTLNPSKKFSPSEIAFAINEHLGNTPPEEYGIWVYYPWSQRLVHLLNKKEFIRVRTSRNHYKITPSEQDFLASKKVGVVGLSVGQSVSVTLAMERVCGELRLADFDVLELTNLNRIRTGTHNLDLPKVYSVAREIAEIDPFIKVKCFAAGLTEKNMDSFFTAGGKLDLMVEESDGFDIKILSRYKARSLKIPVVMEASDRCMVDVERFDLEPKRSILHGRLDHLDVKKLKTLKTTEEKIPYMLDILGIDTCSPRLKASMLEIEQSINTWPQLASAVTMGGGIAADVARRILLNTFTDSGRYYVDIEGIICNLPANSSKDKAKEKTTILSTNNKELKHSFQNIQIKANPDYVSELNTQDAECIIQELTKIRVFKSPISLRFSYQSGALCVLSCEIEDNNFSFSSNIRLLNDIYLGVTLELVSLSASRRNYTITETVYSGSDELSQAIVYFKKVKNQTNAPAKGSSVYHSFGPLAIRSQICLTEWDKALGIYNESFKNRAILLSGKEIEIISDIISKTERTKLLNQFSIYRNKDFPIILGDSLTNQNLITESELSNSERIVLELISNWEVNGLLRSWDKGGVLINIARNKILNSLAIGLIGLNAIKTTDFSLKTGRLIAQLFLEAEKNNLQIHPVFLPLSLISGLNGNTNASTFLKKKLQRINSDSEDINQKLNNNVKNESVIGYLMFKLYSKPDNLAIDSQNKRKKVQSYSKL